MCAMCSLLSHVTHIVHIHAVDLCIAVLQYELVHSGRKAGVGAYASKREPFRNTLDARLGRCLPQDGNLSSTLWYKTNKS